MPLDTVNDIRSMDAAGRSRSEIARMLHVSRNTVAKYADMEDMSPAAPMPRRRGRPALEGNEEWVAGVLEADGREYVAGPAWHGRSLLVGMRASTVEILADRGRRVAVLPRAFGEGPAVRNPLSLVPAIIARPRAFGESTIRRDMPPGLVEGIDRMDSAGRRRTLRSIGRASESSGFEAACEAALRVVEGGRVPDDATVDVLARLIAGGGGGAGGADLSVYDGFLKGAVADGS